jgi:hypothetical protein
MREEYFCCIAACDWGAWALSKAARYDFGSTHSRADMRATVVGDVPACVVGTSDKVGNVRVLEDVLFGFALFRVTARRHEGGGVVGHVGNHFAVAQGMRTEPSLERGCMRG